jgi:hypothetical protein
MRYEGGPADRWNRQAQTSSGKPSLIASLHSLASARNDKVDHTEREWST